MKLNLLPLSAVFLCSALPGFASTLCSAGSGNIVTNCDFENGTTSSTIGGNTNTSVPVSWTANAGYDLQSNFNHLSPYAYTNASAVSIGNDNGQLVPMLSQSLTDVAGATYGGSLYIDYGGAGTTDPTPFFNVQIDGVDVLSLDNSAPGTYTEYTFSFLGTGSDALSFGGNTNPSEWYVDDIDVAETSGPVTPPVMGATPEPNSLLLLATASGPFFFLRQRFARR